MLRRLSALALLCACLAAVPALAPAPVLAEDSGFYASADASYYAVGLPEYSPLLRTPTSNWTTHDGDADGSLAGLTLGWKTESGVFFEARGYSASLESSQDRSFPLVGWATLDGSAAVIIVAPGQSSTKLTVDQSGGELLAGYEIPVSEDLSVSPYAGYFTMELDQHYSLFAQDPPSSLDQFDRMDATFHGLEAGLRLNYGTGLVRARLDGSLGGALVHARYKGEQWLGGLSYHVSDSADGWSGRARLEGGLDLLLGAWTLGLEGGAEYISGVPRYGFARRWVAAHLESGESVSGKLGLNLGYAF